MSHAKQIDITLRWLLNGRLKLQFTTPANSNIRLSLDVLPSPPGTPTDVLISNLIETTYPFIASNPFLSACLCDADEDRRILEQWCFWECNLRPLPFALHLPSLDQWSSNFCSPIPTYMILKNPTHIFKLTSKNRHITSYRISLAKDIIASIL